MDPPWPEYGGGGRGAQNHYDLMSVGNIYHTVMLARDEGEPVFAPADSAHLWMWVTDNHLLDGLSLMDRLGFRYVRTMAWVKMMTKANGSRALQIGLGKYLRGSHELCLLGVKGKACLPEVAPPSVLIAPRAKHSAKPVESYAVFEAVSPPPRLEMFARHKHDGWDVWGNEV
jgi:N6-adenosine-specific RNA methylase IME4